MQEMPLLFRAFGSETKEKTRQRYRKGVSGFLKVGNPTTLAVLEQIICSLGVSFVGTKTSLFSATIMEERELLGQPFGSTKNEFGDEQ